ncbi:MAG: FAD-dependent monooxygenase [Alphaproteobacteria bacterium]|nr:FAD-dependent monooxygenase [Alphaproteobacteria bacterium]
MSTDLSFDVVIAGGGLVGLTLGIALAKGGLETAVVDTLAPEVATGARFDGRVSAIAYASCRMFEALGMWPHLREHAQPILDIIVSDGTVEKGASPLFLHFDHTEIGEPLGHLIENRHTRIAQQAVAQHTAHLTQIAPATVANLEVHPGYTRALLRDGRSAKASLCIAADGRGSPLRALMGIKSIGWPCGQHGIVTTVEHERPHQGVAQEYFLPSGPFAILPMVGNRSSLVWTEREDIAPRMMALSDEDFAHQVRLRFTDYLGDVRPVGPRWSYPLTLNLARRYTAPRFVLAGDAAHGVHPIAGQGFNLGLRDVAALAQVLIEAARLGRDIGAPDVLAEYEKWRRFDNTLMGLSMDALNVLFSNDIAPLRLARDVGLAITDRLPPVRRFFMRLAGGDVGALPRLLRGEAI